MKARLEPALQLRRFPETKSADDVEAFARSVSSRYPRKTRMPPSRTHLFAWQWAVLVLAAWCVPARVFADITSEEVLRKAARWPSLIRTIEFQASREYEQHVSADLLKNAPVDLKKIPKMQNDGYTFYSDGVLYRIDWRSQDGATESFAYNATHYQRLSQSPSIFIRIRDIPPAPQAPFPNPIGWAYYWLLVSDSKFSFAGLRSEDDWDSIIDKASPVTAATLDGVQVKVIEIERIVPSGKRALFSVAFDPARQYLPVQWTSYRVPDREFVSSTKVVETREIQTEDKNMVVVPIAVDVQLAVAPGIRKFRIDPLSLRINHEIDRGLFTLTAADAQIVQDDERVAEPDTSPIDRPTDSGQRRTLYLFLVVFNFLAVIVVILWWVKTRRTGTRSG